MSLQAPGTRWYNAVWRWHFYAGLLCVPFVLWLATTGTIYLWKPQIEAWLERPYDSLPAGGPQAGADAQVAAALAAVPGATLHKYELPQSPTAAARVIVGGAGGEVRVYVDPHTARVLGQTRETDRMMRVVADLHGTLGTGGWGSYLVELAACWAVVMLVTGLYLWWPRGAKGLGGVLWPRLGGSRRRFWRDIHAVAGIWVSVFALFLITTGLPWAKFWGGYFKELRVATGLIDGPQDWTVGGRPAGSPSAGARAMLGDHAGHGGMPMAHQAPPPGTLDRVIAAVRPLDVAAPVQIAPPAAPGDPWTVTSDAADRPLRSKLTVDGATGTITSRQDFGERHWVDQAVGYGIAAHEGALFGVANQILGTLTALLLMTLAVSGTILWWRRRPGGVLGAPVPVGRPRFGLVLIGAVAWLAAWMPLFGASLVAVLLVERLALRSWPAARRWLGLRRQPA